MSHAAVIPRDVFLFQLLAIAQAYVVLTDHLLRPWRGLRVGRLVIQVLMRWRDEFSPDFITNLYNTAWNSGHFLSAIPRCIKISSGFTWGSWVIKSPVCFRISSPSELLHSRLLNSAKWYGIEISCRSKQDHRFASHWMSPKRSEECGQAFQNSTWRILSGRFCRCKWLGR